MVAMLALLALNPGTNEHETVWVSRRIENLEANGINPNRGTLEQALYAPTAIYKPRLDSGIKFYYIYCPKSESGSPVRNGQVFLARINENGIVSWWEWCDYGPEWYDAHIKIFPP